MMVECNECKRIFKSKMALEQHKRSCAKDNKRPRRRRRSRRVRNARVSGRGPDINPSRSRTAPGGRITVTGEDRLGLYSVPRTSATFLNIPIVTGASQRLSSISKAYQRIKWDQVVVTVTPQCPLTVAGGYVAGFIMDPDDGAVTAQELTSAQGSVTRKWFESCNIRMPPKTDLLYTSSSEELRFSSPGNFWIISEGNPSQDIYVVVTVSWRVTLSIPTVEHSTDYSFVMKGELVPLASNYNLQWKPENGSATSDCSQLVPTALASIKGNHFFRVPTFIIEYAEGTGDTGSVQAHFIVYNADDKKMYYSGGGHQIDNTPWQGDVNIQVAVPCGTTCKYVGQGNACQASQPDPKWSELRGCKQLLDLLLSRMSFNENNLSREPESLSSSQTNLDTFQII